MTILVTGIGWVTRSGYGGVATGREHRFSEGEGLAGLARQGLFSHPFRNFGRLDTASRLTCAAVALALQDAGIAYSPAEKQRIGMIGAGSVGSLESDLAYFRDYADNGRTLARANLFIYTLPSSPLGEAAIHFGLTGPVLYATGGNDVFASSLTMAAGMVAEGEAGRMLAGWVTPDEALYVALDQGRNGAVFWELDQAREIIISADGVAELVPRFSIQKDAKGGT